MANKELVDFIKEARARGYDDYQLTEPLLQKGWPLHEIELAIASLKKPVKMQNKVCIYLDSDILSRIEKRAKKNMMTVSDQIQDILRRSVINGLSPKSPKPEKLDDPLIGAFSRARRPKKKK